MKITKDVRKYAADQGIAEEEAFAKGMAEKSQEFITGGGSVIFNSRRLAESHSNIALDHNGYGAHFS